MFKLGLCILAATGLARRAEAFIPTFSGNVVTDFPSSNPAVVIAPGGGILTGGWTISDLRYVYDYATDVAYFGRCGHVSGCRTVFSVCLCRADVSGVVHNPVVVVVHPPRTPPHSSRAGINTGSCITGDADCDGDPGHWSQAAYGRDPPVLSGGEWVSVGLDFRTSGSLFTSVTHQAVVGLPNSGGTESLATFRVARVTSNPAVAGFGATITTSSVVVYNFVAGGNYFDLSGPIGPSPSHPHLELTVSNFSGIASAVSGSFNPLVPCVGVRVYSGSGVDTYGEVITANDEACPRGRVPPH